MVKSAKEKELEKQIAEATAKQAGEVAQAQIEVYEGQNFEARQKWEEAKQKRAQARSKLPEEIPDDPEYKERLLEAQYIEARVVSPKQVEQVREYRDEIKKRQQAKETVQVLDKEIPQLYAKAVEESKEVEKKAEQAKQAEIKKQEALITSYQKQITEEKQRIQREAQAREDAYQAYMKANRGDKSISKKNSKKSNLKLLNSIILASQNFMYSTDLEMQRNIDYQFLRLGRFLERTDMMIRILQSQALRSKQHKKGYEYLTLEWINILKSISAFQAYRQYSQQDISISDIINFFLKTDTFPRSINWNLNQIERATYRISKKNDLIKNVKEIKADIDKYKIKTNDLDNFLFFLEKLLKKLDDLNNKIQKNYFS